MEEKKKTSKLKILLIVGLLVLSAVIIGFIIISPYVVLYKAYEKDAANRVKSGGETVFKSAQTSIVYDKDGNELIMFRSLADRYYVTSEQLDDATKNAFVMLIDADFFKEGFATQRTLIPIVKDAKAAEKTVNGVSPITRKMARDLFLTYDIEEDNALVEVFVANELQKAYDRDQIFEYYINNASFGNGYYGIEAASRGYFNKGIGELSLAEIAFLAAIAEDGTVDPLKDMDDLLVKKNVIITRLQGKGVIDNAQYYSAISEVIKFDSTDLKKHNYLESYVVNCAITELMANDGFVFRETFDSDAVKETYEREFANAYDHFYRSLFTEGYRIYTSIDVELTEKLEEYVDSALNYNSDMTDDGSYRLQGAVVVLDNSTGNVVALVGGRSQESSTYLTNYAFEEYNVLGNVITPLNVYTPFISWHHNPDYIVYQDEAVDGTLINKVTLREAILRYSDDFATNVYSRITPVYALSLLSHTGFKKALISPKSDDGYGYVLATPLELATGYETLANDGTYLPSTCIVKVDNTYGASVYSRTSKKTNTFAANDSRIMTEILRYNLTDGYLRGLEPENAISAALTSTTNRGKNAYMAGYSTYYTVASWVGYQGDIKDNDMSAETLGKASGLWKDTMEYIHKGKEKKEFEKHGPYSSETEALEQHTQPTTEQPSLGGTGGHPGDGDDYIGGYNIEGD